MTRPLTIGITECGKWAHYANWVQQHTPGLDVVKLSWKAANLTDLVRCNGVLLTGGEDVHPQFYGVPEKVAQLDPTEVNERRDKFEMKIIDTALKRELPILGICRGLQIFNVWLGGTLIVDIPSTGKPDHAKSKGYDRVHNVNISPDTQLVRIVGVSSGEVNSSHHQSAEEVGKGLRVSALSDDGIIEGLEWENAAEKPFLELVQWHPERMQDVSSPFSKNLLSEFTHAAAKKQQQLSDHSSMNR